MTEFFWYGIGLTAALLTMFGFVPQMIKIIKTRHVRDISFVMLIQTSIGAFLWVAYGFHISDPIVIIANIVSFTIVIIVSVFFLIYRSKQTP